MNHSIASWIFEKMVIRGMGVSCGWSEWGIAHPSIGIIESATELQTATYAPERQSKCTPRFQQKQKLNLSFQKPLSFTSGTLRFSYLLPALQYYIFNRAVAASFAYLMASTMHFFKSAKFFRPQSFRAETSQLLWPLATQWFEIAKTSQYISSSDLHNFCFL